MIVFSFFLSGGGVVVVVVFFFISMIDSFEFLNSDYYLLDAWFKQKPSKWPTTWSMLSIFLGSME